MTALTSALLSSASVLDESILGVQLPEDFDAAVLACGVSEDALAEVRARSVRIMGHRRRDAAQTFAFGDDLVFVQQQMRGEDVFADFASETYGYDTKYIVKFMRISIELAADRYRCIANSMSSTQLIEMLPRTPQERDEILTKLEQGQKVTAAQIKNWGKEEAPVNPLVQSGRKGLMAVGQSNLKSGVSAFTMLVGKVLARILSELEPEKGKAKAIQKGKLSQDVRADARTAVGHLERVACGLKTNSFGDTEPADLPDGSGWRKVKDVVSVLGRPDNEWPKRSELRSWLTDEVVPTLRWALGDDEAIEAEVRPTLGVAVEDAKVMPAARDLDDDEDVIETAISDAEVEAAVAAPEAVGPTKRSGKASPAKAMRSSLVDVPLAAEDLPLALAAAAERESPRP